MGWHQPRCTQRYSIHSSIEVQVHDIPYVVTFYVVSVSLIGVSLLTGKSTSYLPGSMTLSDAERTREVCAMCWEHGSRSTLYCGLRNGMVQRFSCSDRVFEAECDCSVDGGVFVGLGRHDRCDIVLFCFFFKSEKRLINCDG